MTGTIITSTRTRTGGAADVAALGRRPLRDAVVLQRFWERFDHEGIAE